MRGAPGLGPVVRLEHAEGREHRTESRRLAHRVPGRVVLHPQDEVAEADAIELQLVERPLRLAEVQQQVGVEEGVPLGGLDLALARFEARRSPAIASAVMPK